MNRHRRCSTVVVLASAALFGHSHASAQLVGPTLLGSYDTPSEIQFNNVLVTYTSYAFTSVGTIDYFESNVQVGGDGFGPFTALLLQPLGAGMYKVADAQTFSAPAGNNPGFKYVLSSPWAVQSGDIYAHFGNGIPINFLPHAGDPNAADPLYFPSSGGPPTAGATITVPSPTYPAYSLPTGALRDYGLDAHLTPVPEPGTVALLAGLVTVSGLALRRRKK